MGWSCRSIRTKLGTADPILARCFAEPVLSTVEGAVLGVAEGLSMTEGPPRQILDKEILISRALLRTKGYHCRGLALAVSTGRRNTVGIQPLHDWVLIEPSEAKEKTAGGLFIPDAAKEKPVEGKVLAVGKGRLETPEKKWGSKPKEKEEKVFNATVLKPGDQVLYEKYGTTPIDLDGKELVLVRESDILGLYNKK